MRQIHHKKWDSLQISLELLSVDYPNIMVRFAKVLQIGLLQFEIVVAVPKNIIGNNNLKNITMNGNEISNDQYVVNGNQLTINAKIDVNKASVFQVVTTNYDKI